MRTQLAAFTLLILSGVGASAQAPGIFIFDVMSRPLYRAAYVRMLKGQAGLPNWMATPKAAAAETASPGTTAKIEGEEVEIFEGCEPHNCGGHHMVVLFSNSGSIAKGVLAVDGKTRFFGRPNSREVKAMVATLPDD